jgi:hypothetical protein
MKKYIHIGYPKNFSTSLQRNFFSEHPDIYHLGIGIDSNIGYIDNLSSALFEVYLKSAKGFKYEEQYPKLKSHIEHHYNEAKKQGKKCFGVSNEHFSFGFTYDSLDFKTKILRAIDLFGKDDLNIILVIRNQTDLIKSLYRESVRVGLPGSFSEFIYNLYKFQDRNYLYDFRYDLVYSCLSEHLPKENIHFLIFEDLRDENKQMVKNNNKVSLINKMSTILDIDYLDVDFQHFNETLNDKEILVKSELNKSNRHDLGREMLFSAEIHRQGCYFKNELDINEPEEVIYEDVITKRKLIKQSKESKGNEESKLSYDCDSIIAEKLIQFYKEGNYNLSELLNVSLPKCYFEMNF